MMMYKIRKKYSLLFACLLVLLSVHAQVSLDDIKQHPAQSGGVYYAYPTPINKKETPAPNDYKPFYISHFGRHGSRYLTDDSHYRTVLDMLHKADSVGSLTPLGKDVYSRISILWSEANGREGDLAPLGVRQQRGIAERMYDKYPEVFANGEMVSARSTTVPRCILSMDAFSERLKELNPSLVTSRDASNKYGKYINYHTAEAIKFRSDPTSWRIRYQRFEKQHVKPNRLVTALFSDSVYVLNKIDADALMWGLFEIATIAQNMEANVSLYDIFTPQELFDLWQCKNYRLYVEYANAAVNRGVMMYNAVPVVQNIIEQADKVIDKGTRGADLRFGHDGNIIPLAMLLHLAGTYESVSDPNDFYKAWNDFYVAPMAGNIQLIFYKKTDSNDILVKFLLNENEVLVPVLDSKNKPYYRWQDVKNMLSAYIQKK